MSSAGRAARDDPVASAGAIPNHIPDDVFRDSIAPCGTLLADCSEDSAVRDIRRCHPSVDSALYPDRHRNRADMSTHSDEIHDCPVPLADLDVSLPKATKFGSSESASEQNGDHGHVTDAKIGRASCRERV